MITIPMFPLSILPLPGEIVPLHIFEPRYKQLLQDAESDDISFGIFFNHTMNVEKLGSLMKLESVIKRYPTGESDIVVKCHDIFTMEKLYRNFKSKTYPGGDVNFVQADVTEATSDKLKELFMAYLFKRSITRPQENISTYSVALELALEIQDRYAFLTMDQPARESFLFKRIQYQLHLFMHEEKSKDVFHLN